MAKFRAGGFVVDDTLEYEFLAGTFGIAGEIACRGGIVIRVDKTLEMAEGADDPLVLTFVYAYNAFVRGHGNLLRHDNAHTHPGHADEHHRHDFDWRTGEERPGSPTWVGAAGWPTLGGFIEELERWYWEHRDEFPDPDAAPRLDARG